MPAPSELVERASALVRSFPECFWFRHPEARIRSLDDVRLVIEHLREYGDRRAWWPAQELHRCLSPIFKKNRDVASLRSAGFQVETLSRYGEWEKESAFRKAAIRRENETVEIHWAADSAFRFLADRPFAGAVIHWRLDLLNF